MIILPNGKTRVAIIRGGQGADYEDSMQMGARLLQILHEKPEVYTPLDIYISRDGEAHLHGRVMPLHQALQGVDLVWSTFAHPLPSQLQIPEVGGRPTTRSLAKHPEAARKIFAEQGILTLRHRILDKDVTHNELAEVFRNFLHPVKVRPLNVRAALAELVVAFKDLEKAVSQALTKSNKVVVEEWVRGKEAHVGVIEGLRGEKLYALIPHPSHFPPALHRNLEVNAKLAHHTLGLKHFSSSHFVVATSGRVYLVETDPEPRFGDTPFSHALKDVGLSEAEVVHHLIQIALR